MALLANSSVRTDVTGPALGEFLKEFARLARGDVGDAEAASARISALSDLVERHQDLGSIVGAWLERRERGEAPAEIARDVQRLPDVGADGLNALAREVSRLDHALLVLVGDAQAVLPQLQPLDLPAAVLVDERARPVEGAR